MIFLCLPNEVLLVARIIFDHQGVYVSAMFSTENQIVVLALSQTDRDQASFIDDYLPMYTSSVRISILHFT